LGDFRLRGSLRQNGIENSLRHFTVQWARVLLWA
jgi:hypothetical protein